MGGGNGSLLQFGTASGRFILRILNRWEICYGERTGATPTSSSSKTTTTSSVLRVAMKYVLRRLSQTTWSTKRKLLLRRSRNAHRCRAADELVAASHGAWAAKAISVLILARADNILLAWTILLPIIEIHFGFFNQIKFFLVSIFSHFLSNDDLLVVIWSKQDIVICCVRKLPHLL
jgi:hypothetical protein